MESILGAAIFLVWSVAAWAMLKMVMAALRDREHLSPGWFLGGSFLLTSYNRRNFQLFAASVAVGIALVAAFIVLSLTGTIKH
jgi:hypothetical protein